MDMSTLKNAKRLVILQLFIWGAFMLLVLAN